MKLVSWVERGVEWGIRGSEWGVVERENRVGVEDGWSKELAILT